MIAADAPHAEGGPGPNRRAPLNVLCRAALLAGAISSNACLVLALQPLYEDRSLMFDESLIGRWENRDDQTQLTIERAEWRSYRIVFTERGTSRSLNGNLTQIGDALYMDVTEMRGVDPGPYLIPVHGIFRVTVDGDALSATPLDLDWFTHAVTEKRRGVPLVAIDDRRNVIIASPTPDLRRWLARPPADAFGAPMVFTRASSVALQRPPQDFPDHRLRQLLPELDLRRDLVGREVLATERPQIALGRMLPGSQDDPGLDDLTLGGVRDASNADLGNRGMRCKSFLDFARPHLKAARLDEILLAIDDEDVTVFVEVPEISRV